MKLFAVVFLSLWLAVKGFQPLSTTRLVHNPNNRASSFRQYHDPSYPKIDSSPPVARIDMTTSDDNDTVVDPVEASKILTMLGYRVGALIFMGCAFMMVGSHKMALPLACYMAAGPILAAGVSYCLEGAAVNGRLHTETSKRLNLSLGLYGSLWLWCAWWIHKSQLKAVMMTSSPWVLVAAAITVVNSLKAWAFGASKERHPIQDLFSTVNSSAGLLVSNKGLAGCVYLVATWMVGAFGIVEATSAYNLLRSGGTITAAALSTNMFRFSLYSTLFGVLLCLKDGGDRKVLAASTFIELNVLTSYVLGVMGVYFYSVGSIPLGISSIFFSFFSATLGLLNFGPSGIAAQ
ncbi:expressed unknown protein [Seminavis robusta]|uniref:Uncharacterized protein n=1 Tax=Seminavis robusta TaxID=568900 RepID=A0A9N8H4E1_9STRA|nr:expressed unknown protein [Seminavis robusta]|eukprot:Sro82_g044060.1 n/a (348) ;mRNA; r:104229-105524